MIGLTQRICDLLHKPNKANDGKDAEIAELTQLLKKMTSVAEKYLDLVVEVHDLKKRLGISDALPACYR